MFPLFRKTLYVIALVVLHNQNSALAQDSLAVDNKRNLTLSGYAEIYYAFDFNEPEDNARPDFLYSFHRHNEVNLNLGMIRLGYEANDVRGNFALMAGTYANQNLATEPGVLKHVFEANVGVRLTKERELWLDAGIMPSHIGFESAIGAETWTLTRSVLAENSPYYEAGVRLSYGSVNKKWYFAGLWLNGWQRIQRIAGNSMPSFGTQVTFAPSSRMKINSSSFAGTDKPDSARRMRYFHNFYSEIKLSPRIEIILGFDIGLEQRNEGGRTFNKWYSPLVKIRYKGSERSSISVRAEYYSDRNNVIVSTARPNGFSVHALSANYDYRITRDLLWRVEGRTFRSVDPIFSRHEKPSRVNSSFTSSLCLKF